MTCLNSLGMVLMRDLDTYTSILTASLYLALSLTGPKECPSPACPMYSRAARDIQLITLTSFPSLSTSFERASLSWYHISVQAYTSIFLIYLVCDRIKNWDETPHVFERENWIQHLALFLVMVTCAQEVYSLDLI